MKSVRVNHSLDFATLRAVNSDRARYWHSKGSREWSTLEWAGAMCGEAGEAANVAKKLLRVDLGIHSNNNDEREVLRAKLKKELADVLIYCDLVASHEGIDLAQAVIEVFNQVSIREGFPQRLQENKN
jgi:NTP pyrophosphatase (non-canonical NTP hydrolase)